MPLDPVVVGVVVVVATAGAKDRIASLASTRPAPNWVSKPWGPRSRAAAVSALRTEPPYPEAARAERPYRDGGGASATKLTIFDSACISRMILPTSSLDNLVSESWMRYWLGPMPFIGASTTVAL